MPGLLILLDVFLAGVTSQSRVFPQKHLGDSTAGDEVSHGVYGHTFAPDVVEALSHSEEFLGDTTGTAVGTHRGPGEWQPLAGTELRQGLAGNTLLEGLL